MGRRAYDMAQVDFTGYEYQAPIFVLTHRVAPEPAKGENERLTFTFVADGIESAVRQATAAAGDRNVTVTGSANTAQQCIRAGLADEIHVDLMPALLGAGQRFFEHLESVQVKPAISRVVESLGATHIEFRVVK